MYKKTAFFLTLFLYSIVVFAVGPKELDFAGIKYAKSFENIMGNEKRIEYTPKNETANKGTSKITIHNLINEKDPSNLAADKAGLNSKIEMIKGDKNHIIQTFVSMHGAKGPVTLQQNIWRYKLLPYGKGILAVEYTSWKMLNMQKGDVLMKPEEASPINQSLVDDVINIPLESFSF